MKYVFFVLALSFLLTNCSNRMEHRKVILLDENWLFLNSDVENGEKPDLDTQHWDTVNVPHDWAISGTFDKSIDARETMVIEDGEHIPKLRTGRTGGLPHIGIGWYRKSIDIPASYKNKRIHIEFDGAMSHAKIYMNGEFVGEWPYGYASFGFDVTDYIATGKENTLAVRLENKPHSSRWYPGAGIYRNVRLVITNPVFIKQWGTYITTPDIKNDKGTVNLEMKIHNASGEQKNITVETEIFSSTGESLVIQRDEVNLNEKITFQQQLEVLSPELWSIETPVIYTAETKILENGNELDLYQTPFGFRHFEFTNNKGFYLNGKRVELKGVCLHHDLGPLGAAVNLSSLRHRMKLLKEMGCNAIRTSHNPPAPEMLDLADQMGFLVIDESFDEWKYGKTENGYNKLWDEWAEKDMVALIHRDRNHPSVIMWSIGNEIREQSMEGGEKYCQFLTDICKREDPSRPTTAGFNQWQGAIKNGFADIVDVPGWNYKPQHYNFIHTKFPHWKMYGSETASTVSSRGEYFFPAIERVHYTREPYHCSSFDMEFPRWATSPDREFAAQDSFPFMAGEFVWTGFDYLGEPTPYNIQWPARSSYFGIIDLCGIPKDRYYLYQSKWSDKEVLHLLPHWNWDPGQKLSVHCYTNFEKAELFLNGESAGIAEKDPSNLYTMYRLIWDEIIFQPGELKVVALDKENNPKKETVLKTAGEPARIKLDADRNKIQADGKDLAFITVTVTDVEGTVCPLANHNIEFQVDGEGFLRAVGNGDPTSLESFIEPNRKAFNGKCMAIVQAKKDAGIITLTAKSQGLESSSIQISVSANKKK